MRPRPRFAPALDLDTALETLCDPTVPAPRQAEVRQFLIDTCGPFAEAVLRVGGRAAAVERERAELREQLDRMVGGTQLRGIVTGVNNGHVRVQIGPTERVLGRPAGMALGIGQVVYTDGSGQAVLAAGEYLLGGATYAYCETLEGRHVLVRALRDAGQDDARQLAIVAESVDLAALRPDDRVLGYAGLELGNVVLVTRRLGPARHAVGEDVGVSRIVRREEIVGLDDVLARLERLFLTPATPAYAALLAEAERTQAGVVLVGPPGCGKSLLADFMVGAVRARGGRALVRTASSYLSKWVGDGAARMRADFAALDRAWEETGVRPLLVVDELEGIALDRSQGFMLHGGYLDVLDTLLAVLTRSQARMIGISNVGDRWVDTALTRDGRLPLVRLPATLDAAGVAALVTRCLARVALDAGAAAPADAARGFGEAVSDLVFAPNGPLAELLRVQLADGRTCTFGAADLATPAAVADGAVRPLLERIVQRDSAAGLPAPRPLACAELLAATTEYFVERCRSITRENVRSHLPDRLPEDQAVVKVERTRKGET